MAMTVTANQRALYFTRQKSDISSLWSWHLDSPKAGLSRHNSSELNLKFQGWLLYEPIYQATVWVDDGQQRHSFELTIDRPSVVEKKLGADGEKHPLRRCGFQFELPLLELPFEFGFRVNGQSIKVLDGQWLTEQQIADLQQPKKRSLWQRLLT
ncbi:hypothetical protein M3914_002453 [Vibrio metschnikovii]|uniref:hypothetical protein n=1 Tax=Vibrio metschnikovii TaxID=28172 RepID=UPI001C2FC3A2|nr:hypothetical protein [Vibrio metschnikovii]EKO3611275.1 hypothetical protein [Vibrio metschnikovii]EKO3684249.1 hypothetical protein [Vibrio metschnikovii]